MSQTEFEYFDWEQYRKAENVQQPAADDPLLHESELYQQWDLWEGVEE